MCCFFGIPLASTAPGHRASDITAGSPNHSIHNPIEIGTAQSPTESYKMTHYSSALPNVRFFLFPQALPRLLLPAGQSLPPVLRPAGCPTGATSPPGSHTSRASCRDPPASGSGWSTSSSIQRRPDGQSFPSRGSRETDPLTRRVHDPGTDSKTTAFGLNAEFRTDTIRRDLQQVEHRSLNLDIQASWCGCGRQHAATAPSRRPLFTVQLIPTVVSAHSIFQETPIVVLHFFITSHRSKSHPHHEIVQLNTNNERASFRESVSRMASPVFISPRIFLAGLHFVSFLLDTTHSLTQRL